MFAMLTPSRLNALKSLRRLDPETASELRAALFASIKTQFGIPTEHRIKVELDDTTSPRYAIIVRKTTGTLYTLDPITGKWLDPEAAPPTPVAPRKRWFAVDISAVRDLILDTMDFDDGHLAPPPGAPSDSGPGSWFADVADNAIYVCLSEDDF